MTADPWAEQRYVVRTAIKDLGLTQKQVAADVGITEKHLSQMLLGRSDGKLAVWVALAQRLGLRWMPVNPRMHALLVEVLGIADDH